MTKTMARVRAATSVWKTVSHRAGNPAARLTTTHETTAARTSSAAAGREASRSTRDSHRLTRDLDGSPGGSEIGRASCRERVEDSVVGGAVKKKRRNGG